LYSYSTEDFIQQKKKIYRNSVDNFNLMLFDQITRRSTKDDVFVIKYHHIIEIPFTDYHFCREERVKVACNCTKVFSAFISEKEIESLWEHWTIEELKNLYTCCDGYIDGSEYWIKFLQTKDQLSIIDEKKTQEKEAEIANYGSIIRILKEIKKDATELLYHRDNKQNADK
jgi:hypothetical protein